MDKKSTKIITIDKITVMFCHVSYALNKHAFGKTSRYVLEIFMAFNAFGYLRIIPIIPT